MEHRSAAAGIAVDQRVGGAAGRAGDAEAAGDRLDERGLPRSEVALEGEERAGRKRAAERLSFGLELGLGQDADHARRRTLAGAARRTSGAEAARSSLT